MQIISQNEHDDKYFMHKTYLIQKEMKDDAFDQWVSCLMVDNADHEKFGSLQHGLSSQCGSNNDQCPKNIESVTDVSNNHDWGDD